MSDTDLLGTQVDILEKLSSKVQLSIVIPLFNEANTLEALHRRLSQTLIEIGVSYEIVYVDDGSTDNTGSLLNQLYDSDPKVTVIRFNRNFGQHPAILAAFRQIRGEVVVTLDGDLQNPPEEIPKLLKKLEEGYDVVGGWRQNRRDSFIRRILSFMINRITCLVVGVKMHDYGCMLRAYRRVVVEQICQCQEISSYVPLLANTFARSVAEVPVDHSARNSGKSRYTPFRLLRLNFDLLTGFSLFPIQVVSFSGIFISILGISFGIFLAIRRIIVGPEVEGVFTLFSILFFFIGLQILALGLIGEYIGRIYMEVRHRPRYVIKEILDKRAK